MFKKANLIIILLAVNSAILMYNVFISIRNKALLNNLLANELVSETENVDDFLETEEESWIPLGKPIEYEEYLLEVWPNESVTEFKNDKELDTLLGQQED